jgi:hypothetical protein
LPSIAKLYPQLESLLRSKKFTVVEIYKEKVREWKLKKKKKKKKEKEEETNKDP